MVVDYKADIGKTIFARGTRDIKGTVKSVSSRYCAACQSTHTCYIVKWDDGTTTKPCTAGVKVNSDGTLQIM